jgi:eukaryotic-like serine/threonine-protein kinase
VTPGDAEPPWPESGSVLPGASRNAPDGEQWQRVRALFEDAVERDEGEWPDVLAAAPEEDRELLSRLLAADRSTEPLLDRSPDELAADVFSEEEPPPQRIGPYRILGILGRGGMGQVFRARHDEEPGAEDVAIKLLRRGMDSEDILRRFRAERQILARLTHPNIARLRDGGITTDGRPYVVMECVQGSPITTHCETHGLSLESRLRLFAEVCSGVEHAHAHGIVHRDLKPRNIVVSDGSGSPAGSTSARATVKLLDFGIAKVLEPDGMDLTVAHTHTGSRFMTLEYASPEQIRSGPLGPASDVYSLGVVLHELLTGRRPHDLAGLAPSEVERVICESPPKRLTSEGKGVPSALQAIILMALRKEPERRYGSAGELGDDVRRFLAGEAVRARGDSLPYRVRTFVRRRTVALALLAAVIGMSAGLGGFLLSRGGGAPPAGAAAALDQLAIAVLPFDYAGPEGQEYFADGLVDVVNAQLAGLPGLRVISPDRSAGRGGPAGTPREIATELGVEYLLAGSVSFDGTGDPSGRVVVESRLLRVADDSVVWSQAFEHTMVQFLAVQSVIAREVARALRLDGTDGAWAARGAVGTSDLEAYRLYLRGNDFIRFNEDEERLRLAEASYLAALARDSTFGEAWAKLSTVHTQLWFHRYDASGERLESAQQAAERALRNHPDLPETHYALAYYQYQGRGDLRQAQRYFEQALEFQPNHVRALFGLASVLRRQGRMEEALARFQELTVLEPLDANYVFSAAFTQQLLRNYPESERLYDDVMRRASDLPMLYFTRAHLALGQTGSVAEARRVLMEGAGAAVDNDHTRFLQANLDLMAGRYREALATTAAWRLEVLDAQALYTPVSWLRAAAYRGLGEADSARAQEQVALRILEARVDSHPEDARAHGALGRVYATLGRPDEAVRSAKRGKELTPLGRDAILAPFRMEDLAAVYVLNGQLEEAIAELESLLSVPGMLSPGHLRADPLWAPLLDHPRLPADR